MPLQDLIQETQRIYKDMPVGLCYLDTDLRFIHINDWLAEINGIPAEEHLGRTLGELIPDVAAGVEAQYRQVIDTGEPIIGGTVEAETPAQPGIKRHFQHSYFPIRSDDGAVIGISCVVEDVTVRNEAVAARNEAVAALRQANDELEQRVQERTAELLKANESLSQEITEREQAEESSRKFIAAIDSMNEVVNYFGADDRLVFCNERYREINSAVPENLVPGVTFEDQMKAIVARDLVPEAQGREDEWLRERLERHRSPKGPFELLRQDGIWLLIHEQRLPDGGMITLGTDITERKAIEESLRESRDQLRLVTDGLPISITRIDSEQRYRFANKCSAGWYGRSSDDVIGKHVKEVMGSEYEKFRANVELALSGEAVTYELAATYPDGVTRDVRVTYVPEMGTDLRPQGFFSFAEDITEDKKAEEQLRQAQKMEAVGQLTAGVAHDFNNMLGVISGNAELLEDELGEDNPRLATMFRATKRGAELTQRLLAFSRKQVLNPEIVNANNLISDITGLLRRTLEEHIDIETVTAAGLWNCEVDPAQLENALVNLALNARDAMPDGGKLTIETANARLDDDYAAAQAEVSPGRYVMLAVTDTGTGMPQEVQEHVFEPFFTTKAVGHGSGLGLSMVYGFVKQSGGHVTVYSEEGEGTTIKLYLPRSTESTAVERKPVTDEVPVARGETVLVVEDDPDLLTLAVALLSNLGYQVMGAGTGAAALEQLGSTTRVNLLLTDVVLPGSMNGRELATEAERRAPGIQVLFMSGYTEDAIVHHGRLDADAKLLQKPFRRADLARAVRSVLDGP